ncbi:hypothetical protein [Shimia sp.]|uniref:hypothetical protein n=1 Tax=Shimia sp. TaxID=1954381 RepID=UPI0032979C13
MQEADSYAAAAKVQFVRDAVTQQAKLLRSKVNICFGEAARRANGRSGEAAARHQIGLPAAAMGRLLHFSLQFAVYLVI